MDFIALCIATVFVYSFVMNLPSMRQADLARLIADYVKSQDKSDLDKDTKTEIESILQGKINDKTMRLM